MITMVENEKSSGQQPVQPQGPDDEGLSSVPARFNKVEAAMREGFARVDQSINGLRGEMNTRFLALEGDFKSLQRTLIGSAIGVAGAILAASISALVAFL